MKKEYLILGIVIVALSCYLVFHSEEKTNYKLPEFSKVAVETVTAIDIEKNKTTVTLAKEGEGWTVSDNRYPVDSDTMKELLDVIEDFQVTALVSQSRDLKRYELDPENAVKVTAKNGSEAVRTFEAGKVAPTYKHTFVKLDGENGVFHAPGNFRRYFDKDVEGFRSKKVFTLDRKAVTSLVVEKGDVKREFVLETKEGEDGPPSWKAGDDKAVDPDSVNALVSAVSDLECSSYAADAAKGEDKPLFTLVVDDGEKETLSVYDKAENDDYPGVSSGASDRFILASYQGNEIVSKIDAVLGIKPE
ncbi:MAG: DUF4340 domain-containing protein [Desulfobacteraceae bacterium]|nr:DUF4340 domain-containing protein [Desulfobacteraceae bacterium]